MRRLTVAAAILSVASPLTAAEPCATLDSKAVAALFDDWNFALSSLDANQVVQRYWPNAVLLPTVSNTPRTNSAMIGDYFEHFLAKRPRGRVDTRTIQSGCNVAMDMGTYTFSTMDEKGATSEVAARYTFIYQYRDGAWKILHHHSSAMPESSTSTAQVEVHAVAEKPAPVAAKPVAEKLPAEKPAAEKAAVVAKPVKVAQAPPAPAPAPTASHPNAAPEHAKDNAPKVVAKDTPKSPAISAAPASKSAAAAPAPDTRTALFANLISSPPPSKFYPPESAKKKERGKVNLSVCADSTGTVAGNPEVVKSSGSKLLDEAAQTWAKAAKWVPATMNREPVEGCAPIDVVFEAAA